jgi:hypothetical protein
MARTLAKKASAKAPAKRAGSARAGDVELTKAEAKDALARTTRRIDSLRRDVDRNAWRIGHLLAEASELGLHRAAGFASVEAYAEDKFSFSRTASFQYMRVARAFTEGATTRFGVEKLDRGLAYIAKTPEHEAPADVPTLHVRVPTDDGGVVEKPFADVTVRELRLGAQHEAEVHGHHEVDPVIAPHVAALARANRALDAAVGRSNATRADVSLHARDGLALVDVRGALRVVVAEFVKRGPARVKKG